MLMLMLFSLLCLSACSITLLFNVPPMYLLCTSYVPALLHAYLCLHLLFYACSLLCLCSLFFSVHLIYVCLLNSFDYLCYVSCSKFICARTKLSVLIGTLLCSCALLMHPIAVRFRSCLQPFLCGGGVCPLQVRLVRDRTCSYPVCGA